MASQPPKKALAFDVVVPEGTSPEDVVDATSSIVGIEEVYCVQHFGGRNYQVTVNSEAALAQIVDASHLIIRGERVAIVPLGPQVTQVTVLFLPCRVPSEVLAQALSPYGKVLHITRGLMGSRPTVTTGTRYVRMEMKASSPVPNYLKVAGHRVTCDYKGIQRVCRRCGDSGHFRMNCTAPFCGRCGVYGHDGKGCSLPCRRCGDPHATVACTIRPSYSEAASKDFPPLQPGTPSKNKCDDSSTRAVVTDHDQGVPIATLHQTPTASPTIPGLVLPPGTENLSSPRPVAISEESQAKPSSDEAPREDGVSDGNIASEAPRVAALSTTSSGVIEESTSQDDDACINEDSNSTASEAPLQIDEDTSPSDISQDSGDVFVPSSLKNPDTKRHRITTRDLEAPTRDRSPLRTSTRSRKPRASGGSPGRKK